MANKMLIIGTAKFNIAYGAYSRGLTSNVEAINTPQVFQGTNGEVSVPPSSRARSRFFE